MNGWVLFKEICYVQKQFEEGFQVRVTAVSCSLLSSFGDLVQEREDLFRADPIELPILAHVVKEFQKGAVEIAGARTVLLL